MTLKELEKRRRELLDRRLPYSMVYWAAFDYEALQLITYRKRAGRGDHSTYNDIIIMGDTETSKALKPFRVVHRKEGDVVTYENHVVAWTISLRAYDRNLATLYGRTPSDMMECIRMICESLQGEKTIIYFHNLAYDYVFLRKFLFRDFGFPTDQLNTKPHYPIRIEFENGLILKDSLILAQRGIEKWADDLKVEHQKAVGLWDYDRHRTQHEPFTDDEMEYIEHDTLAGVECLDTLKKALNKHIYSMPYTATGIPREEVKKRGKEVHARDFFDRTVMTFEQYKICEQVYHGGYTHANRHELGYINEAQCYDFASSYPYVLLSEKYPMERWSQLKPKSIDYILRNADEYAFMFRLILVGVDLKDALIGMPALQFSKAVKVVNGVIDNGRILSADYVEIFLNELDLAVIAKQYKYRKHICIDVHAAIKKYLPRYLTDYIFQCFKDKTMLKGGDPVLYALAKAKLNSIYGMMVQKCIRDELHEDFETGEYLTDETASEAEQYAKYLKNRSNILLYQWGTWVTSYAFRNLFELGECVTGTWLYSDTDSIYATAWDQEKVRAYNEKCIEKLKANGYGGVEHNGRMYFLGCAETDGDKDLYTEFVTLGAKRYAGRNKADGELHITVAGVPKKGAACLNDDIRNFKKGLIFGGDATGKLMHAYIYKDSIEIDEEGNEVGDSIDLNPCNYLLDRAIITTWDDLEEEEISIQYFDEEELNDDGNRTAQDSD